MHVTIYAKCYTNIRINNNRNAQKLTGKLMNNKTQLYNVYLLMEGYTR